MALINKSRIKEVVKELQKNSGEDVSSVADEVGTALERKVENILEDAIARAKANKRRTLQARDL
jgi:histone H3/H4